jgi:phage nucleotide-binding protein
MSVAKTKLPFEIYRPEKKITHLKIGIYGDPGVGKTSLAATAPRPLFLNCEAGDVALRNKDIDVIRVDDFSMMPMIMTWLEENAGKPDFYQTVVIDSLTELSKRAMDNVLKAENRDMPHQADWGRSSEYVRRVVRKTRDLPIHTVYVLGSIFKEDAATGISEHMPNLPGKLAPEVAGYFDILGFLTMVRVSPKEYGRRLMVQPSPKWRAKDRTNTLGTHLDQDQFDLTKMVSFVNGKEVNAKLIDQELAEIELNLATA